MVTQLEKLRWKLYELKISILFNHGIEKGLIKSYGDDVTQKSKTICCGSIPLSILLLDYHMVQGRCYNRAALLTLCFWNDDFKVVTACIDDLKYNPFYVGKYKNGEVDDEIFNHCFVERKMEDGTVWVYDTSTGLMFEKSLYYRMQNPKIIEEKGKEEVLEYLKKVFKINRKKQNNETIRRTIEFLERESKPMQREYIFAIEDGLRTLKNKLDNLDEHDSNNDRKKLVFTRNEDD